MTGVEEIMSDLTCTWTKRLVTWLVFGPNDLSLDLTFDQMTCDLTWTCKEMTCDLTWTCKEMTCDLTWTCKEMTCDLTWTCKKRLAAISDSRWLSVCDCQSHHVSHTMCGFHGCYGRHTFHAHTDTRRQNPPYMRILVCPPVCIVRLRICGQTSLNGV